jgi:hypothetical protein
MDPNQVSGGANGQPQHGQLQNGQLPFVPAPQATIVPIGESWVPGVSSVPVAPRSRRLRWGIAGAVVLCVAIVTAAGAFVLSGAVGTKSLTASVAPKNTIAFLEVRTDLPGDQHAKLAEFMSHFPGFKDQSKFDTALDELLNRLTGSVSPDLTYTSAFKPWMEGEVSIAVTDLGAVDTSAVLSKIGQQLDQPSAPDVSSMYSPPGAVAIVALKDRAAAQNWITGELTQQGLKTTSQVYAGTTLYTIGAGGGAGAYALTDQDLVLGTVGAVKASLDAKTKGSLADNAGYKAAMGSFSGDSLATFFVDSRAIVSYYLDTYNSIIGGIANGGLMGASPLPALNLSSNDAPAWIAGSVRAESSQMVVDVAMPRTGKTSVGNHASQLASVLPGDTVGVMEVHSIGKLVTDELAAIEAKIPNNSTLQSVDGALSMIGGLDWLGDGAAVVTRDGSTYGGGLVVQTKDASTAGAKVAMVGNLITFFGASANLTSRDETYKGVDITVVTVPSNPVSTVGSEDIAFAARGNLIVAGVGDAFVKAVIDTTPSTSLGSQSDYSAVTAAAGSSNEQSFYVNIPALEDQIGQAIFAESPSKWTLDYKPYFDHLGGVGYSVVDGNTVILRFVVTAK